MSLSLTSPLTTLLKPDRRQAAALKRLQIETLRDLLYHYPTRYENLADSKRIGELTPGMSAVVYGEITHPDTKKSLRGRVPMATARLKDDSGILTLTWFHQPYFAKMYPEGTLVKISGTVGERAGKLSMVNPAIETIADIPTRPGELELGAEVLDAPLIPIYPASLGITSNWFTYAIRKVLASGVLENLSDPVPKEIIERYHLPSLATALVWLHTPKTERDAEAARKRLAFDEIFFIQLGKQQARAAYGKHEGYQIEKTARDLKPFLNIFPFSPTKAQSEAIETILADFTSGRPMLRLLEGDVGSGKTAVAAATMYAITTTEPKRRESGERQGYGYLQAAYMAPTEILAKQQFENFIQYFAPFNQPVGLITGSGCYKFPSKLAPDKPTKISRAQLLKWVANGEIPILVGTHSLIQKSVVFKHLGFVVIDEQHRFGTKQRQKLVNKDDIAPHFLSMSATPIPRTLSLTIYGDLDLTLLDELPPGRLPVITKVVPPTKRTATYEAIKKELDTGRQAYILCPRIDEPDPTKEKAVVAKSVTEEAKRLQREELKNYRTGTLHGKMTPAEKDEVMRRFSEHELDVLVTTSVVEVGVNVPNATVIVIEGAERFGLAQLHQLRGRVVRSSHQAYCYVFTESGSKKTKARLEALQTAKNGFELAEHDLRLRGAGELYGRRQAGLTDLGMEAIKNIKMVEAARTEAAKLIEDDLTLKKYPELLERVEESAHLHSE